MSESGAGFFRCGRVSRCCACAASGTNATVTRQVITANTSVLRMNYPLTKVYCFTLNKPYR